MRVPHTNFEWRRCDRRMTRRFAEWMGEEVKKFQRAPSLRTVRRAGNENTFVAIKNDPKLRNSNLVKRLESHQHFSFAFINSGKDDDGDLLDFFFILIT